jgi:hypothetical protein
MKWYSLLDLDALAKGGPLTDKLARGKLKADTTVGGTIESDKLNLQHTFNHNLNEGATKPNLNLMDYPVGTELVARQWESLHDLAMLDPFQDDADGAYDTGDATLFAKILQEIRCANYDGEKSIDLGEYINRLKLNTTFEYFSKNYAGSNFSSDFNLPEIYFNRITSSGIVDLSQIKDRKGGATFVQKVPSTSLVINNYFSASIRMGCIELYGNAKEIDILIDYLNPSKTNLLASFSKVSSIANKAVLTKDDLSQLKQISACESRFFTPAQKFSLIKKIFIYSEHEYYEDLILDLLATPATERLYRVVN